MGTWRLESVNGMISAMDQGGLFGNNIHAHYKLTYTPSTFGSFTEMPTLDWHERILMKEHHKGEWWEFETNMYAHNPTSKTLEIWPKRYIAAYDNACGRAFMGKGNCKLVSKAGGAVSARDLGQNITDSKKKAEAVRSYLQKKGGSLLIEIHDIPSINHPTGGEHKERLLLFNVGVIGSPLKLKMEQYLDVDGAKTAAQWGREARLTWAQSWDTRGLSKVPAPPGVSAPRNQPFFPGEYP
ncbi:MAG TPA: hypothetical protein VGA70_13020 [Longimicrobiales bacterium]|jgi:hypothetical protein